MQDYFGKDISVLKNKKLFLFDMDGTIYNEEKLFDGVLELLEKIEKNDGKYVFVTNNSSKSVSEYIKKLEFFGIKVTEENFFTSTQAAILLLQQQFPNKIIYCQGTEAFINEIKNNNINVTTDVRDNIDLVLIGFDTELTSDKLRKTCEILQRNIPYYATNPDLVCPVKFGYIPDCGSICGMIKNAVSKEPIYIGKPEPIMINTAMSKFGMTKDETIIIGDRLYTDIASGVNAKVDTICVLSGETKIENILQSDIKPTYILENVKRLLEIF